MATRSRLFSLGEKRRKRSDVSKSPTISRETAEKVQALVERARAGDFGAYLQLNGFTRSSTPENPRPLVAGNCHREHWRVELADLRCKTCGEYHLQDMTPRTTAGPDGKPRMWVPPVTCPHCGAPDCAGPLNHFDHEFRGGGKTESTAIEFVYRISLHRVRGYKCEAMIVGANQPEAMKRLALVATIMRRDGHRLAFPEVIPYAERAPGKSLRVMGDSEPTVYAYGIEGVPPGFHGDLIWLDDVCNQNNTMMRPGMMGKIVSKFENVVEYSQQPWTVMLWTGTPWRQRDLDDKMEAYARANPTDWSVLHIACGGPEDGFTSPWPEKWPSERLKKLYAKDPLSYRRAMQLQRIADEDIVFRQIRCWISAGDDNLRRCPPAIIDGVPMLGNTKSLGWPIVLGLDAAFTGEDAPDKRGRSLTGIVVAALDPKTKWVFILYSWEGHVAAGDHLRVVLPIAKTYGVNLLAMEIGGALSEVVERFTSAGFMVESYNPRSKEYGGSKSMRKLPVAAAFNEGRAFLGGFLGFNSEEEVHGVWKVIPITPHLGLRDAMLSFPSQQSDVLDACEIACRVLWKYYGQEAELPAPPKVERHLSPLAWRRRAELGLTERKRSEEEELVRAFGDPVEAARDFGLL